MISTASRCSICILVALSLLAPDARGVAQDDGSWREAAPPHLVPPAGPQSGIVWDSRRGRVIAHKGAQSDEHPATTWSFDGSQWRLEARGGPSAGEGSALAYDVARRRVVLFGGLSSDDAAAPLGETWEWNGKKWRQRSVPGPSPRAGAAMAYDAARGSLILHGSASGDGETWAYDSAGWRLVSTAGPAVASPAMAYDADGQRVVLFGGDVTSVTWEWNGSRWAMLSSGGPAPRTGHAMAYDAAAGRVVLSGGFNAAGKARNDVWELVGDVWSRAGKIPPRGGHGMTYDANEARLVIFGGATRRNAGERRETRVRHRGKWVNPVPRDERLPSSDTEPYLFYDAARRETVLFDSITRQTWVWNGVRWRLRAGPSGPSRRFGASIAYDPQRGRAVLFGGAEFGRGALADTWEWNGRKWNRQSSSGPIPAYSVAMAYDPRRQAVMLFGGGVTGGAVELRQFWQWKNRRWQEVMTSTIPEQRAEAALMFDARQGQLILTGGYSIPLDETPFMQTWDFDGTDWRLLSTDGPGNRAAHAMVADPVTGGLLLFGGFETQTSSYEPLNELWSWDGSIWSEIEVPDGDPVPFPDRLPAIVYDEARDEFLMFGSNERNGTWIYKRSR